MTTAAIARQLMEEKRRERLKRELTSKQIRREAKTITPYEARLYAFLKTEDANV